MSYNVDSVRILKGSEFRIAATTFAEMQETLDQPESIFLGDGYEYHQRDGDDLILENLWWHGEGSGNLWDVFEEEVIPQLKGEGRLLVTWEGGDTIEMYTIADGEVISKETME